MVYIVVVMVLVTTARKRGKVPRNTWPPGHSTIRTLAPIEETDEEVGNDGNSSTTTSSSAPNTTEAALYDVFGNELEETDEAEADGEQNFLVIHKDS